MGAAPVSPDDIDPCTRRHGANHWAWLTTYPRSPAYIRATTGRGVLVRAAARRRDGGDNVPARPLLIFSPYTVEFFFCYTHPACRPPTNGVLARAAVVVVVDTCPAVAAARIPVVRRVLFLRLQHSLQLFPPHALCTSRPGRP